MAARRRATGLIENVLTHRGEKGEISFLIFAASICVSDGEVSLFLFFVNTITFFAVVSFETENLIKELKQLFFFQKGLKV